MDKVFKYEDFFLSLNKYIVIRTIKKGKENRLKIKFMKICVDNNNKISASMELQ